MSEETNKVEKKTSTRSTSRKTTTSRTKTAPKTTVKKETVKEAETRNDKNVEQKKDEKTKRVFEPTDLVPCTNIFAGTTVMVGNKTKNIYTWEGLGVTEYVEYQDLRSETLNKRSVYIYEPLIVIDDEDFVAECKSLDELYSRTKSVEEIIDLIENGSEDELRHAINTLPVGFQNSMRNIAATMIQEGTLDSIRKIRVIDELMGTKLCEQLDLFIE